MPSTRASTGVTGQRSTQKGKKNKKTLGTSHPSAQSSATPTPSAMPPPTTIPRPPPPVYGSGPANATKEMRDAGLFTEDRIRGTDEEREARCIGFIALWYDAQTLGKRFTYISADTALDGEYNLAKVLTYKATKRYRSTLRSMKLLNLMPDIVSNVCVFAKVYEGMATNSACYVA